MAFVDVLGVEFYPVTLSGALKAVDWMLSRNDGFTRLVITGNPVMVMNARRDPVFMNVMKSADLMVPDGVGILWAARKLGGMLPERVTGMDLVENLLGRDPPKRVFFLGGKPGVAEKAKQNAERRYSGIRVVGVHHGYFGVQEEGAVVNAVKDCKADLLLAGMGSPRQEKFIWRNRSVLGARVGIGVGGVLDILAGDAVRAPRLLQKAGLEWLYRLAKEPRRLKTDLALAAFAVQVCVQASKRKVKDTESEGDDKDDEHNTV